ncbi:hypothetical protein [Mycobacterium uberis]|nr:hypothetical protein [Mycobacterium uberis]
MWKLGPAFLIELLEVCAALGSLNSVIWQPTGRTPDNAEALCAALA